jgi:hypothetical protein
MVVVHIRCKVRTPCHGVPGRTIREVGLCRLLCFNEYTQREKADATTITLVGW